FDSGSSSPGEAGSGICLAQTTTFMARHCSRRRAVSTNRFDYLRRVTPEGEVRLAIPVSPEFLRLARLAAAGLASRMGFTYDEVEDLRIAIDELCFSLVGNSGRPGTIALRYWMQDDSLVVEGVGLFDDGMGTSPALSPLSHQILKAVVDEHELTIGKDGPEFRLMQRHNAAS